jgi:LDH2 family malate/lactate/ureidoglycolate dehydrogenase
MTYHLGSDEAVNYYPETVLKQFSDDMLRAIGATEEETAIITEGLMTASLWWHPAQGQGIDKLFMYHRRVRDGGIVPGARMTWTRDGPSTALLDGANGFGYVAAYRAMERAVEKARQSGVGMVGVRNSNHFGIAGYHAVQATKHGLIGWALTNARAEMAPWGSAKMVLGTNPWGIAIPRPETFPIVLDMALTMSGKGMMRWYQQLGRPIPDNWALTPEGRTTTDPAAAMDGPLLPIGEYKGYGLSLVTDILSGVMTGALFGLAVFQNEQSHDVGHMMVAIDPESFLSHEEWAERLEQLVAEVKSAPPIDPARPVLLPGEAEYLRLRQRRQEGIPVARATVEGLRDLAATLQVEFPL